MGITQAELGQAIGVKFQQIQKYETGANRVSASRLWAIADALCVDVIYFFKGIRSTEEEQTGEAASPEDRMSFLSDRDTLEMMELYNALPVERKLAVLSFVRSITETEPVRRLDMKT